jgi:cysteine desulfurase
MKRIYLDYAATTPTDQRVTEKIIPYYCDFFGNPSSIYEEARIVKKAINKARNQVANSINSNAEEIFFTSGGTEADNWALKGIAETLGQQKNHIITTAIEHSAVLQTCKYLEQKGFEITYLPVDCKGMVSLEQLENSITDNTAMISIMYANNEIGTIQPVNEISRIAHNNNIIFHSDAVQGLGNIPIDVKKSGIDLLSISSHKIYGPKGVGALYVDKSIKIGNLIHGGKQEKKLRSGTENVPGIIGFGFAAEIVTNEIEKHIEHISSQKDYFLDQISNNISDVTLNGHPVMRLPGNVNLYFQNVSSEALIIALDMAGISASGGSACSSGSQTPSHVLIATGQGEEKANNSIRFTIGRNTTKEEIDYVINQLIILVEKLRNKKH